MMKTDKLKLNNIKSEEGNQHTSNTGNGIDDVFKHCKQQKYINLIIQHGQWYSISSSIFYEESTFARNIINRSIFSAIVTQYSFVNSLVFPWELFNMPNQTDSDK